MFKGWMALFIYYFAICICVCIIVLVLSSLYPCALLLIFFFLCGSSPHRNFNNKGPKSRESSRPWLRVMCCFVPSIFNIKLETQKPRNVRSEFHSILRRISKSIHLWWNMVRIDVLLVVVTLYTYTCTCIHTYVVIICGNDVVVISGSVL